MLSSVLVSSLLVLSAFAAPAPESQLQVSLKAAKDSVTSNNFVIDATVTNPTQKDIRIVKWNTLLDNTQTQTFELTKDGQPVGFRGFKVAPDLENDAAFTTIAAGQSVTVSHNLGTTYDFSTSGTGKYTVKPIDNIFQLSTSSKVELQSFEATSVEVEVTAVDSNMSVQQTNPTCSDGNKLNFLRTSLAEARALAGGAASDVRNHPSSASINRYFGGNSRDTVWWNLDRVAGDLPSSGTRVLNCQDPNGVCNPGIIAYTLLVTSGGNIVGSDIFACDAFWGTPATNTICSGQGIRTRGSVILHELTHAVFASTDVYGCDAGAALSDPDKVKNADNYACYAVDVYRTYNC